MKKRIGCLCLFIFGIGITACAKDSRVSNSIESLKEINVQKTDEEVEEVEKISLEQECESPAVKEQMEELGQKAAIDYDFLTSEGYEILEKNITATVAGNVREHPLLKDFLKSDIEFDEDFCNRFGSLPGTMEYFLYDINGDDVDDYIVCYYGVPYVGSGGNSLCIYIQEKDTLKMVFSVNAEVHLEGDNHAPIAILKDSEEGYHSLVLPYTNNRIWRYDKEEWYCSE